MKKSVKTYQFLFRKSRKGEPLKLGLTSGHYKNTDDLFIALPELHGKVYDKCWYSEREILSEH